MTNNRPQNHDILTEETGTVVINLLSTYLQTQGLSHLDG